MAKQPELNWPASKVELWPLKDIIPYHQNARHHSDAQVDLIAKSMLADGVTAPILVDESGSIIYGHGRRAAAIKNGFEKYPVSIAKGWSEEQKRAVRIKDNSLALMATWNEELLRGELNDLSKAGYDMPLLGFDNISLVTFMANVPSGGTDPEDTPELPRDPVSRLGDMWTIGAHRILCGDSTVEKDVQRVLKQDVPRLMVTDQPYGVDYDADWRNEPQRADSMRRTKIAKAIGTVQNDDKADWSGAWRFFSGDVAYVWHGGLRASEAEQSLIRAGFAIRAQIIWNKSTAVIGRGHYHWKHEACWYAVRQGKQANWSGDTKQNTMWDIERPHHHDGEHSTQKPVECMRRPIQNNSRPGEFVYDPFLGSGTTAIAASELNRWCLGIEINPAYVDVAVERLQAFMKMDAKLVGENRTYAQIAAARKKAPAKKAGATPKKTGAKNRQVAAE